MGVVTEVKEVEGERTSNQRSIFPELVQLVYVEVTTLTLTNSGVAIFTEVVILTWIIFHLDAYYRTVTQSRQESLSTTPARQTRSAVEVANVSRVTKSATHKSTVKTDLMKVNNFAVSRICV